MKRFFFFIYLLVGLQFTEMTVSNAADDLFGLLVFYISLQPVIS